MTFPVLRIGSVGTYTELLQLALYRLGFIEKAPDGVFGPATRRALIKMQAAYGLAADGIAGPAVWRALRPALVGYARHTVRRGDTLARLADRYYTTVAAILTANPGVEPQNLRVGTALTVPYGFPLVTGLVSFTPTLLELTVEGLTARYPAVSTGSIGKSVMGRDIPYLTLGSGRRVMMNASHHANEWITTPLVLRFFEELAREDGAEGTELTVVPMVNPDGVALVTGELDGGPYYGLARRIAANYPAIPFPEGWKANIEGVDPNLQYPAGWEEARRIKYAQGFVSPAPRDFVGTAPLTAPESRALFDFTVERDFEITLSWHTQGEVIFWKYLDMEPEGARELAERFSAVSGYAVEDVPVASGYAGYKDWFILNYDRPGFTIEAGRGENPLPLTDFKEIYPQAAAIMREAVRLSTKSTAFK